MVQQEIVFGACQVVTPAFAARLAQAAAQTKSEIYLELGNAKLNVDSLISILSMDLHPGARLTVCAEGEDEVEAGRRICALLAGKAV